MGSGEMKAVKTSELVGAALDWVVAVAIGYELRGGAGFNHEAWFDGYKFVSSTSKWQPSTDWSQGGPLIEKHQVELEWNGIDGKALWWLARHEDIEAPQIGDTLLIAACRAIVAANLGDEVQIPAELMP